MSQSYVLGLIIEHSKCKAHWLLLPLNTNILQVVGCVLDLLDQISTHTQTFGETKALLFSWKKSNSTTYSCPIGAIEPSKSIRGKSHEHYWINNQVNLV